MESMKQLSTVLGSKAVLTAFDIIELSRKGIKASLAKKILKEVEINQEELADYSGINKRTINRKFKELSKLLSPGESEKIIRLAKVFVEARETFEDHRKASEWLKRPNNELRGQLPISLLDSEFGSEQVLNVLGRIREGVFK